VEKVNIVLYGAEDAGEIALRWILRNPDLGYKLVGFLDDDSFKWGRNIHGINILGGTDNLERIIEEKQIGGIVVTSKNLLRSPSGERLLAVCRIQGVWVRTLRLEFELTE
jgi:FlaA1/EpsC-like NDP-sugar epimerase